MNWFSKMWAKVFRNKKNAKATTSSTTTTVKPPNLEKYSISIAINDYPSSQDLRGCLNDAKGWKKYFKEKERFDESILSLDGHSTVHSVKTNIKFFVNKIIDKVTNGIKIVFVITYSGHGSSLPDNNNDEKDGRDETWCLYDGQLRDDFLREQLDRLPQGVSVTIISDSCHSGTVTRSFMTASNEEKAIPRYLPPKDDDLASRIGTLSVNRRIFTPEAQMNEILISGCKSTEYSYDASFNGVPMGAFSRYALEILNSHSNLTYEEFYKKLKEKLPSSTYPQTPCLEGSKKNKKKIMFSV